MTIPPAAEPPTQEQGSVRYWLAEAVRDLNRARGEITTPAEDRLIDVCGALIAALAAHRAPPTQEPTSVTIKSYTSTAEAPPLQMCTCSVITGGHRVPTSAGCPVHGRG